MSVKVALITGPRPAYGFCPVPPLTDSAPERNLYRLTEYDYGEDLDIHTVSACSQAQLMQLRQMQLTGCYHWIPFQDSALEVNYSKWLQNRLVGGLCNRILHAPDVLTRIYLNRACKLIQSISPDLIFINSLPQYIRMVRGHFPNIKLGLFVRGEMGNSRKYLPLLDCIITNSEGISNYVRNLLNGAPVPIYKIPNTLDADYCTSLKTYRSGKRIIYTGRMDPFKGVLELLQAFACIQEQCSDAQLTLVGGNFGNKPLTAYEQKLVDEVKGHNLAVEFIGQIPNKELPEYYQQADLAVFPSIILESFGMVALEAMRCGLPVVASRRPGFEELIVEGETGLLVNDPEDIKELTEKIAIILANPDLLRSLGENGYLRSLEYLPSIASKEFLRVVKNIMSIQ